MYKKWQEEVLEWFGRKDVEANRHLSAQEIEIVRRFFGIPGRGQHSLERIGKSMRLPTMRVFAIKSRAVEKIVSDLERRRSE